MNVLEGVLTKMATAAVEKQCEYSLSFDSVPLRLNDWVGKTIEISFDGEIFCQYCQSPTKKSYSQGYCYIHSQTLARCDLCILKPEMCHHHLGTCREPQWGLDHCMQPHIVYLSNTTGLKVGITRKTNMPGRWIDQGACQAVPILEVDSRLHSGVVEVALAKQIADKTNWRALIKSDADLIDLSKEAKRILEESKPLLQKIENSSQKPIQKLDISHVREFSYPIIGYPDKVKSLSLDKSPVISGRLLGIKAQYLLLDTGAFNVRKHTGYKVRIFLSD